MAEVINVTSIKGYKVFNPDWTCRNFQYKVGETFIYNGNIDMCGKGFHFCQKASDCFYYYTFDSRNKVAEVEAIGLVETRDDKSVTDKIKIVREIEWQELLTIVNEGKNCTGLCNTGNHNTGDRNTGNWNAGDWNIGDCNAGDYNTGNWNIGNYNIGNCNAGNWNSTNYSTGFFNSEQQPIYMFNKPTNMKRDDVYELTGIQILNCNYKNSWWIYAENMTPEEKAAHPEYKTIGGYLKTVDFKTACRMMWDKLDEEKRQAVMELPNFDTKVFEEITSINVNEGKSNLLI